ncbi:MAG: glucokinase [Pseudomonadota bacterium]
MRILCGDIGGTHSRLAVASLADGRAILTRVDKRRNADFPDFPAVLAAFLAGEASFDACCLAVAGPTDGRRVSFTNLDWQLDAQQLAARFGFPHCSLVNDFSAVGWGLNGLSEPDLAVLQAGQPRGGAPRVALGAGTGLGVSLCPWRGDHYQPMASEGGHLGFAPTTPEQDRLLAYLRQRYGRVSLERILSGPGMEDLYRFCRLEAGLAEDPGLAAAQVSQRGLTGADAQAVRALGLFTAIYGQTAGDLALAARADGGVFLAGGIAPRLLDLLGDGRFLAGFRAKGRFAAWMEQVPVAVVLDPDIGLKGAALAAGYSR